MKKIFKRRPLFKSKYVGGGWYFRSYIACFMFVFIDAYWNYQHKKGHWKYSTQYLNNPKGE